ncbi:diguanylate cyclase [Kineococcus sp. SYSU DK004]|uniref:diguanylate cyclase n=1 Tax=Kineococcus sp. SYSU DK004 TaxID=3383125 RepID=UPI003D7CDEF9
MPEVPVVPAARRPPAAALARREEFGPYDRLAELAFAQYLAGSWDAALRACREGVALCTAAGDETTVRYLSFTTAACLLEVLDPSGAAAEAQALLDRLPEQETAWRAKTLALLADARLALGRTSAAMDALARAHALAADPGRSYNGMSAAFSTATAFRSLLLFELCQELLEGVRRSPWLDVARTAVLRAVAVNRTLWGCCLALSGDPAAARAQHVAALSDVAALAAAAREGGDAAMARRALALEGFLLHRLGEDPLALARVREALAGGGVRDGLVELRAARLALAVVLARSGEPETARAVLAEVAAVHVHEDRELWEALGHEALAEVESAAAAVPAPVVRAWRQLARASTARLWRDRESRFEALTDRIRLRALDEEAARASRELRTDPLTGLGNRRELQRLRERAGAAAPAAGGAAAVLFVDVDDFKAVNDTFSHAVGDAVLRRLADVVRGACRGADVPLRYGGDEFVVVLADPAGAGPAARRVLEAVRRLAWDEVAPGLRVRVSVGSATRGDLASALAAADAAMLAAKRSGRDRLVTG